MKNQYFGDERDYVKYGLLRCFAQVGWRIGVCWMLTPDDSSGHGGRISYLRREDEWRQHDPFLFDTLKRSVGAGAPRCISIAYADSFIPQAQFFAEQVPDEKDARNDWLNRAFEGLSGSDLLFFDPDIGLEATASPSGRKRSTKHLYRSEIKRAWNQGASLLIFQFFRVPNDSFATEAAARLHKEVPTAVVTTFRTTNVLFLLAYQPQHRSKVKAGLRLVKTKWKERISIRSFTP